VHILTRKSFGLAAVTCCAAGPLIAQTATDSESRSRVWSFRGIRAEYCVRFLIKPDAASRKVKDGYALVRADQDPHLHSALRHTIQGQPEFAGWAPSRLCFYFTDTLQLDRRRFVEKDSRKHQMIGVWTLAARDVEAGTRRDLAVDMYASRGNLVRAAEGSGVRLREAESVFTGWADATADTHRAKLDKTLVIWRGRPAGDSTRVAQPVEESWSIPGRRSSKLSAGVVMRPQWSRSLVGSLTVEGKGDLAKALKASPIRFVGPLYWGGSAELRFTR
jgi:hypothetical protein